MSQGTETTQATIDWAKLRADFPILEQTVNGHPLVYLDNAASSQNRRSSSTPFALTTNGTTPTSTAASTS